MINAETNTRPLLIVAYDASIALHKHAVFLRSVDTLRAMGKFIADPVCGMMTGGFHAVVFARQDDTALIAQALVPIKEDRMVIVYSVPARSLAPASDVRHTAERAPKLYLGYNLTFNLECFCVRTPWEGDFL